MVGAFRLGAEAIKVDIGRAGLKVVVICVPLFLLLSAGSVEAAREGKDTATTAVGYLFAVFFALPALLALLFVKRLVRARGGSPSTQAACTTGRALLGRISSGKTSPAWASATKIRPQSTDAAPWTVPR